MTHLIDLSLAESLELLRGGEIGRVGMTTPHGPRVVPVTYRMFKDDIVFRTSPYSELGTHGSGRDVAFEVDHYDTSLREGWSVLAVGRLEAVDDAEVVRLIRETDDPQPWAGARRNLYMRLPWRELTGRRVRTAVTETTAFSAGSPTARTSAS